MYPAFIGGQPNLRFQISLVFLFPYDNDGLAAVVEASVFGVKVRFGKGVWVGWGEEADRIYRLA